MTFRITTVGRNLTGKAYYSRF